MYHASHKGCVQRGWNLEDSLPQMHNIIAGGRILFS